MHEGHFARSPAPPVEKAGEVYSLSNPRQGRLVIPRCKVQVTDFTWHRQLSIPRHVPFKKQRLHRDGFCWRGTSSRWGRGRVPSIMILAMVGLAESSSHG